MKFKVERTSEYRDEVQPCKEAHQETYTRVEERTVNKPEKLPGVMGVEWTKQGTNHRVERGHIMRDFEATGWFIEFNSLEDLMTFIEQYGSVVIEQSYLNHSIWKIEIYDGYRE